jgi:alpha-galactosidase
MKIRALHIAGYGENGFFRERIPMDESRIKIGSFSFFSKFETDTIELNMESEKAVRMESCVLETDFVFPADATFLVNGYQSWTASGEFPAASPPEKLSPGFKKLIGGAGDYFFYQPHSHSRNRHSHWFTAIGPEAADGKKFWIGSDQEHKGYTLFEADVRQNKLFIHRDLRGTQLKSNRLIFRLLFGYFSEEEFADRLIRPKMRAPQVGGWTSWYYHYSKISEETVLKNLSHFQNVGVPGGIFQIDDGWQKATGDWLSVNEKFPGGMKNLAERIRKAGYTPGLWLAPFVASETSHLYKNRPELLLTHDGERPVRAGFNPGWGSLARPDYYALDIYRSETGEYLERVFDTVLAEWGFAMVKLDFLFAAGMIAIGEKARGEVMYDAMKLLRKWCGKNLILGCGVPLSAASGQVDYCRVGADISHSWEIDILKSIGLQERISTMNSLRNTISRNLLSGRSFLNDPDVFILRSDKVKMNPAEKATLFRLNLLFGDLVFTSDDISAYDADTLKLYKSQFPLRRQTIRSVQQKGRVYYVDFSNDYGRFLLVANLSDRFQAFDFSGFSDLIREEANSGLRKHESVIYPLIDKSLAVQVVYSDMHIFPGSEFDSILPHREGATFNLNAKVNTPGTIYFLERSGLDNFRIDGQTAELIKRGERTLRTFTFTTSGK